MADKWLLVGDELRPVEPEGGGTQVGTAKMFPTRVYLALMSLRDGEEGQTLVEYALILALVSVTAVAALQALSGGINGIFNAIVADL